MIVELILLHLVPRSGVLVLLQIYLPDRGSGMEKPILTSHSIAVKLVNKALLRLVELEIRI